MKKTIIASILLAVVPVVAKSQQVSFSGGSKAVFEETPAASTGLDKIYVIYDNDGVSMNYVQHGSGTTVTWYTYDERGGGYAEVLPNVERVDASTTRLPQVMANCGYIIEEGTDRTYLWVVDYSDYMLTLGNIGFDPQRDCGTTRLYVGGSGGAITYYTINGVPQNLDRGLTLTYRTLEWNDSNMTWDEIPVEENIETFSSSVAVPAPYCNTEFTLHGDRFLRFWGMEESVTSDTYLTSAVAVESAAIQEGESPDNEKGGGDETGEMLGGSAPVTITFSAYGTDVMVHNEWQMSRDQGFNNIDSRFYQSEVTQTFNEGGTFYFRFYGADSSGECVAIGETYTVFIGESSLECPNAFSPQASVGINDEWKVSYRSIVEFNCWIFNRWGAEVCHLTDPSQGWDGKYKGKYVKPGTYFYVIEARGSDGVEYNLKGDINILNYTGTGSHGMSGATE